MLFALPIGGFTGSPHSQWAKNSTMQAFSGCAALPPSPPAASSPELQTLKRFDQIFDPFQLRPDIWSPNIFLFVGPRPWSSFSFGCQLSRVINCHSCPDFPRYLNPFNCNFFFEPLQPNLDIFLFVGPHPRSSFSFGCQLYTAGCSWAVPSTMTHAGTKAGKTMMSQGVLVPTRWYVGRRVLETELDFVLLCLLWTNGTIECMFPHSFSSQHDSQRNHLKQIGDS